MNDFLVLNFKEILDYNFTAKVEEEFDEVAEGKLSWRKMLEAFYKPFHEIVVNVLETSERASGERLLGIDPKSGKNVFVRIGRFGPMVQIGNPDDEEKPRYSSLRKDQRLDSITLEEALVLFKLPRTLGLYEEAEVVVSLGRFGPYIKYKEEYTSLPRTDDPYTVTLERCIEILKMPRLPRALGQHEGEELNVSKGRFGPFIKFKEGFYSLAKTDDPFAITLERAIEIIKAKQEKDKDKYIKLFPDRPEVKVIQGRYGPCIQIGRKFYKIPKDKEPSLLTVEECFDIAGVKSGDDKKVKGAKSKTKKAEKPKTKKPAKKAAAKKKK